jgi:hypothetical protein
MKKLFLALICVTSLNSSLQASCSFENCLPTAKSTLSALRRLIVAQFHSLYSLNPTEEGSQAAATPLASQYGTEEEHKAAQLFLQATYSLCLNEEIHPTIEKYLIPDSEKKGRACPHHSLAFHYENEEEHKAARQFLHQGHHKMKNRENYWNKETLTAWAQQPKLLPEVSE